MSASKSAPYFYCSSFVAFPPLNACFFTFFSIYFGVSVMKIPEFGIDADIFPPDPCKEGKNFE